MFGTSKWMGGVTVALVAAFGLWSGFGRAQAGLPDGVAQVSAQEAAAVQGGCSYFGLTTIGGNIYGCGGAAKAHPTTTTCPQVPVVTCICTQYTTEVAGTCNECGVSCGAFNSLSACAY